MKETELRIGNCINRGLAKNTPLDDVIFYPVLVDVDILKKISTGDLVWDFEPIKITEEWLVKIDFEKYADHKWFGGPEGDLDISFKDGEAWMVDFEGNIISAPLKYVHQLQNLYFALTGEELEIKHDHTTSI